MRRYRTSTTITVGLNSIDYGRPMTVLRVKSNVLGIKSIVLRVKPNVLRLKRKYYYILIHCFTRKTFGFTRKLIHKNIVVFLLYASKQMVLRVKGVLS